MTIPLKKEPEVFKNHFWGAVECCHFCKTPTLFWPENTNNPVCGDCAKKHKVSELPDYGKNIRKAKRKLAKTNKENKLCMF